jgi:hypothetical protein
MSNEIKIILTGDASGAVAAVSKLQNAVTSFGGGVRSFNTDLQKSIVAPLKTIAPISGLATAAITEVKFALQALVASSVIGAAVTGLIALANGFFSTKEKVRELTDAQKRYNEIVKSSVESTGKEATKIALIVDRLQEGNLSRQESIALIKELQKTAPDYFGTLDAEKAKVNDVARAYLNYNNSLVAAIENQIRTSQLTDIINKRLAVQQQFPEAANFINEQIRAGKTLNDISNEQANKSVQITKELLKQTAAGKVISKEKEKELLLQEVQFTGLGFVLGALKQEQSLLKEINDQDLKKLGVSFGELGNKATEAAAEVEKNFRPSIVRTGEQFAKSIGSRFKIGQEFGLTIDTDTVVAGIDNATEAMKRFGNEIEKQAANKAANDIFLNKQQQAKDLADVLTTTLGPSFTGLFNDILSGSQNAFQAFGQAIKQVITKLIAAAVSAAIFAAIISVALGGSFVGSFKSVFSQLSGLNLKGLIPKFASGTRDFRGGLALVGERGPELVNLPKGSDVIPNHMLGGGDQELFAFIDNRGIYLSNKRGGIAAGRLG